MDESPELRLLFHRLNNQLGIILAHAELLEAKAPDDDEPRARGAGRRQRARGDGHGQGNPPPSPDPEPESVICHARKIVIRSVKYLTDRASIAVNSLTNCQRFDALPPADSPESRHSS